MSKIDLNTLSTFIVIARERSFTRAAAQLGVSQSALSHTIRKLEEGLGIRLLTRTTRGVSPTEAGERMLSKIGPYYEGIEAELTSMTELRDKPAGTVRITTHDHASSTVLWPKLAKMLPDYPDVNVEISINYGLTDIVGERFDAGIRSGDMVAKDMVAVRIAPDMRMTVVGSPSYFKRRPPPQALEDLTAHDCINLRLPTHGGLSSWEFTREDKTLQIQVQGQLVFNTTPQKLTATLEGFGLAYLPEDLIQQHVSDGRLVPVLEEWWPTLPGYHLYYPSRRQPSPAFSLVLQALRLP